MNLRFVAGSIILMGLGFFVSAAQALSPPTFYTSESQFLTDTAGQIFKVEGFESLPLNAPSPLAVGDVTVSGPNLSIISTEPSFGSDGLVGVSWAGAGNGALTFAFAKPITAFGIHLWDFGTTGPTTLQMNTAVGSQAIYTNYVDQTNGQLLFAGFVAPAAPFSSVTFVCSATADRVILDRLQYVEVPEPVTLELAAIALGLALVAKRSGGGRTIAR
jgi:hypothetical protein